MAKYTRSQFDNMSEDEKHELMNKKVDRPSARPMGDIYPQRIRRILEGDTPKQLFSMYTPSEEEKEENLKVATEREEKQKIFNDLRKYINPTFCPKCGHFMRGKLDEKFYRIRGHCFNCQLKYERKIRDAGLWNKYEAMVITSNKVAFLRDLKQEVEDYLNNGGLKKEYEYVTEKGKIEIWKNDNYQEQKIFLEKALSDIIMFYDDLTEYVKELNEELKDVEYVST